MDIINHYEVINYDAGDKDKYTNMVIYSKCTIHYMNGKIHRDNDQPAVICDNGIQYWYVNGQIHRDDDKPAVITPYGTHKWYVNGKKHRDNDQPAEIWKDGTRLWYVNGNRY